MTNKLAKAMLAEYLYVESRLMGSEVYFLPKKYIDPKSVLNLLLMKFKSAFLVSIFFFASMSVAQANNLPITVAANESITVTFFFPSEIQKVIKPAVNYKFEYEQHSTMGTLVARKGATSNLTVITKDGSIFSFLLQYDQEVNNFTYVLSADQAIGTMNPSGVTRAVSTPVKKKVASPSENEPIGKPQNEEESEKETAKEPKNEQQLADEEGLVRIMSFDSENNEASYIPQTVTSEARENETSANSLYDTDRESYYDIFCENNYDQELRASKVLKAGIGIELQLNALTADKNEFYFIFQVTNRLTSQFKAEELRFYVRTLRGDEPLHMTPLHVFNHQEKIEAGRTKKMVYVLKEFRLSKDQKVFVVLDERDGSRNTVLNIDSRTINAIVEKTIPAAR